MGNSEVLDYIADVVELYLMDVIDLDAVVDAIDEVLANVWYERVDVPSVHDYCVSFRLDCEEKSFVDVYGETLDMVRRLVGRELVYEERELLHELMWVYMSADRVFASLRCLMRYDCEAVLQIADVKFVSGGAFVMGSRDYVERVFTEIASYVEWAHRFGGQRCYEKPSEECFEKWRRVYTEQFVPVSRDSC